MSDAIFRSLGVRMLDGTAATARATGNNAAWICPCGKETMPLIATWFPKQSETVCPTCGRRYRFDKDADAVVEIPRS
jgi:hypothetical protein